MTARTQVSPSRSCQLPPAHCPSRECLVRPEEYLAVLARRQPAIVLSTGSPDLRRMRRGLPRRTAPSLLLAPCPASTQMGGGFSRVRHRVRRPVPHFCWDKLPIRVVATGITAAAGLHLPVPRADRRRRNPTAKRRGPRSWMPGSRGCSQERSTGTLAWPSYARPSAAD
jgi:hypothetical protein